MLITCYSVGASGNLFRIFGSNSSSRHSLPNLILVPICFFFYTKKLASVATLTSFNFLFAFYSFSISSFVNPVISIISSVGIFLSFIFFAISNCLFYFSIHILLISTTAPFDNFARTSSILVFH